MPTWIKTILIIAAACVIIWAVSTVLPDSFSDPSTLDAANSTFPQ